MEENNFNSKSIFYPPGGILMWIIIFLELITFGMALIAMAYYGNLESEMFHNSKLLLSTKLGTLNTVVLLTSGLFMALTVHQLKANNLASSKKYLLVTIFFGFIFLVIKTIEYSQKLTLGYDIGYNTFFGFYWMLTLFHVVHVIIGLAILGSVYLGLNKKKTTTKLEDVEASATFWHLCDLIWLLIFPVIYLIF